VLTALYNGKKMLAKRELSRAAKYLCPKENCRKPELVLKSGTLRIPHFVHKKGSSCNRSALPESQVHEAMKRCFRTTLDIDCEFVEYTKIEGVRSDILLKNKYVIEITSSLSIGTIGTRCTLRENRQVLLVKTSCLKINGKTAFCIA
jgi:competence CoiA-like predicted nuclease